MADNDESITKLYHLTDDEAHWIAVAIEASKDFADRLAKSTDLGDQLDAGLLVQKYTELQKRFPPPPIRLKGTE